MAKPYADRLSSMFKPGARASDVMALIAETDDLITASKAAETAARKRAIDPAIPDADARNAAHDAQDHAFATERLAEGRRRLEEQLTQLTESEHSKIQAAEYQRVAAETAALAEEIRKTVPSVLAKLVDLFSRIEANDAAVAQANRIKPGGAPGVIPAEFLARGCGAAWWPPSNINPVDRLTAIKLPKFDTWGFSWPIDRLAESRRHIEDQNHRQRVAYQQSKTPSARAEARAREEARWTRYEVSQRPYSGFALTGIEHRKGVAAVSNTPVFLWMHGGQAEQARRMGLTLEPAPAPVGALA